MKAQAIILIFLFPFLASMAQGTDYIGKKEFQAETKRISEGINASKRSVNQMKQMVVMQKTTIDSLKKVVLVAQAQAATGNELSSAATLKIRELQTASDNQKQTTETGFIFLGVLIALLAVTSLWWIFILSGKTDKRFMKATERHENYSLNMVSELSAIREKLMENQEHILFLSDDLKQQVRKIDLAIETDREKIAMLDERAKNMRFETESGFKLHTEKVNLLQESMGKLNLQVSECLHMNEQMHSEIQKVTKMVVKQDKEKEKLA